MVITIDQIQILNSILGSPDTSKDELIYYCPSCHHKNKKLSVNIKKGVYHCWVCHIKGKSVNSLVRKYGSSIQYKDFVHLESSILHRKAEDGTNNKKSNSVIIMPQDIKPLLYKSNDPDMNNAKNYLINRGIEKKDFIFYKIMYCFSGRYRGRVLFPSFDNSGNLNYFLGRSIYGSNLKYLNSNGNKKDIIFNELYIDWKAPVIIVEGIIDAIKAGHNAIPLLGSSLSANSILFEKLVENKPEIILALDKDAFDKACKIGNKLLEYGINIKFVDIRKSRYNDLGEMPKGRATFYIERAIKYDSFFKLKTS